MGFLALSRGSRRNILPFLDKGDGDRSYDYRRGGIQDVMRSATRFSVMPCTSSWTYMPADPSSNHIGPNNPFSSWFVHKERNSSLDREEQLRKGEERLDGER